jgi:hypothetical protein
LSLLLPLQASHAEDLEITEIEEGQEDVVIGPAVVMTEDKFRAYVKDSRELPVCLEGLEKAIDLKLEADERALNAIGIARGQFEFDEDLIDQQVQAIADLGAKLDTASAQANRLRNQRNVAWGIAGGFLAASTAATVLAVTQ